MNSPREWTRSWWLAAGILALTGTVYHLHRPAPVALRHDLRDFPAAIGEWRAASADRADELLQIVGADDELRRDYQDREGRVVHLYVAYFESQDHERKLVSYRTSELHRRAVEIDIPTASGATLRVNRVPRAQTRDRVLFWYAMNGRVVTSRYTAKLVTMADALVRGRTNGALVAVTARLAPATGPERDAAEEPERDFARVLLPVLMPYLDARVA